MAAPPSPSSSSGAGAAASTSSSPSEGGSAAPAAAPASAAPALAAEADLPGHWARPEGPDAEVKFVGNISPDGHLALYAPHLVTYTYRTGPQVRASCFFLPPCSPPPTPTAARTWVC